MCIKDYARDENVIARVDPVFTEHRFNSIPVRIIIDVRKGKSKTRSLSQRFPRSGDGHYCGLQEMEIQAVPARREGGLK